MAALFAAVASPAGAATSTSAARKRQEQVRKAKAEKAKQLNGLKASDAELDRAVNALSVQVRAQGAKLAAARQAVGAAEASVRQAENRIAATERDMTVLSGAVLDRAVAAYVRPQQSTFTEIADSQDLGEASRRASMLRQVANKDRDVIDRLRAAKEDLGIEREKADAARQVAAKRREAERAELGTLQVNLKEKARLERALSARIQAVTAEVDALAREDAAVTELIRRKALERASRGSLAPDTGGRVSGAGLRWPVGGPVTSEFGSRWGRLHAGIDIGSGSGTPIRAAKAGTVIFAGSQGGYGNVVIIDHGGGLTTLYAHQSRLGTNDGAEVSQGEVVGFVGSTGHSTGPHLHFETRVGGSPQNPRRYLP
ncbi:MAG: peptidoglycan DD-metalloendopeptidase family protein [Actinobacteria bacterium]|nr:peptidoglycan DD-metalloendopeptidase family protein [Actinomycetota bacterium]